MLYNRISHFFTYRLLIVFMFTLFGNLFGSDSAMLCIRAKMKAIRAVSVSCDNCVIETPFYLHSKGLRLDNLIRIKITYNGHSPIKLVVRQKKQSESDMEKFAFHHELKNIDSKIDYSIFFNKTKLPVIDGIIFAVDDNSVNPIIEEWIGLDVYIHPLKKESSFAGKYVTNLELITMGVE